MSLFSDLIEPNNLRLLFGLGSFFGDLTDDLREDLSFARIVGQAMLGNQGSVQLPANLFPPLRHRPLRALQGKRVGLVASGGSGALASLCGVRRAFEEAGVEVAAISASLAEYPPARLIVVERVICQRKPPLTLFANTTP